MALVVLQLLEHWVRAAGLYCTVLQVRAGGMAGGPATAQCGETESWVWQLCVWWRPGECCAAVLLVCDCNVFMAGAASYWRQ